MRRRAFFTLLAILFPAALVAREEPAIDRAFELFWKAGSIEGAEKAAKAILATGAPFTTVLERLEDGRPYKGDVETGEQRWATLPGGGPLHATTVVVPKNYNPVVKYPVRVYLHGGVARPDPASDEGQVASGPGPARPRRRIEFKEHYIAVYPTGYADAQWWFANQMTNFALILDRLKRTYNVDENRVHLMGVSDGGTGAFYAALKDPTPWSVFFPLNGLLTVLANPAVRADGELFTTNLTNRPIYAVNGEVDALYPPSAVFPTMVMLKQLGVDVTFRLMKGAGHDVAWWPNERPLIDTFEEEHPRDPLPETVSLETDRTDRYSRIAWLVVDRLDPSKAEGVFAENNILEIQDPADFGMRVDSSRGDGRKVIDVIAGTNAANMGMKKGDTVVRVGDTMIRTVRDLGQAFDAHPAGTPLEFEVDRKGERVTFKGVFPPPPPPVRKMPAFRHAKPGGRITVTRKGNRFEARTRGVGAFTLLLSPSMIDFDQKVAVIVNGKAAFEGQVARSVEALLRHAARDNDRTMLFGAELKILVP